MITVDDLKLTIEFWKWLCELTEDYFIFIHHKYIWIENKKTLNRWRITKDDGLNKQNPITLKNIIESIIYQAIDEYNGKYAKTITQDYYCNGLTIKGTTKDVYYSDYENKTTARIAALWWIFNQGVKDDSI